MTVRCEDGSSWQMGFTLGRSEPVMMELPPCQSDLPSNLADLQLERRLTPTPTLTSHTTKTLLRGRRIHITAEDSCFLIRFHPLLQQLFSAFVCIWHCHSQPACACSQEGLERFGRFGSLTGCRSQWHFDAVKASPSLIPSGSQPLLLPASSLLVWLSVWFDFRECHE